MKINLKALFAGGAAILAIPLALQFAEQRAPAADHLDPPARTNPASDTTPDAAADIADIYAFQDGASTILILTFAGPQATDRPAVYDRDVLYTLNVSNATPRTTANFPITFQFGQDMGANGSQFGIRVRNLPGVTGDITGAVETDLVKDGVRVRAGLFDDPFFFDSQGFRETVSTGTLSFNNQRDFFAGQNISAVIIEIPTSRLANGTNPVDIWATTARFGGQL
ncbi:DUF4331 family protein [Parasphingorhabdus halotolerans]|uniref:DUF4331 domain-containing protein n=1 Tax=Parasphingorhabdus halotolerans TaxID=2725558 RepID=A0A6H2DP01_9SPHN|nr:DUF4331 family protein [Parasphingorhabdus halotolerans]QJB70392.1 DUF4331 domain-containing protein [Parasphingorhabdus halotolerans]